MHAADRMRLQHMIEAADSAVQFMAGRQRAELETDRMLLFAVVRASREKLGGQHGYH